MATRPGVFARLLGVRLLGWEIGDLASRVLVGALFLALAIRIGTNSLQTGRVTGLLLLASEGLVVVLMIIRRPSGDVDRSWMARLITTLSMVGPPLVRPLPTPAGSEDVATAIVSALGLGFVVLSKLTLGRSFGLVPANRGIVSSGPYRFVRHPIYLGYLMNDAGFLLAHLTVWNLVVLLTAIAAQIVRILYEETMLAHDASYAAYRQRVRWRVLPHVF
jgi:protein-S-isoprenylcysteine O-methyltransferase Ste14